MTLDEHPANGFYAFISRNEELSFSRCTVRRDDAPELIACSDLPTGFLAAQIVHAAGEASVPNLESGTSAVVLSMRTEAALSSPTPGAEL